MAGEVFRRLLDCNPMNVADRDEPSHIQLRSLYPTQSVWNPLSQNGAPAAGVRAAPDLETVATVATN
jgi:hypothetical protein